MPFADQLIGTEVAEQLIAQVQAVTPEQPLRFLPSVPETMASLSLRERADALRDALLADFPSSYAQLATVIRKASEDSSAFTGWMIWPVTTALATRAVHEDTASAFNDAMDQLAHLTSRLTAEFAIRVLLKHDLAKALAILPAWTRSTDEHVRRLASEGTRPYLPWAIRVPEIIATPNATIPILDALYRDESQYVRRSVANHLNDLSRHAPQLVLQTAESWLQSPDQNTIGLIRHGLRTLIKRGDTQALALLGFGPATLEITGPHLARRQIEWGGSLNFTARINNCGSAPAPLAIDYVVHHLKANGTNSPKVFKLLTRTLAPGESMEIDRNHSLRTITTRRYYPGAQSLSLQINGVPTVPVGFELLPEVLTE